MRLLLINAILSCILLFTHDGLRGAVIPHFPNQDHCTILEDASITAGLDTIPEGVIERMPRFPGCEDMEGTERDKEECSKRKMVEYIYSNQVYPEEALKKGIEGTVVVKFTVAKDGYIEDIELLRGIGHGIDEAALEIVESFNDLDDYWTPGIQNSKYIKVKYTLPIKYKLQ